MKVLVKLFYLSFFAFSLAITSCTVEEDILTDDSINPILIDPSDQDASPPLDPNN
ncbi:hypothetical protein GCM10023311_20620 [Flaviramulus aquimarinus]|uniref:Secreted protein n=1 Tax=Flaviramulus aquimarinus TaxID=1170456 RepID=A0ABP9F9E3_9FLAO